MKKIVLTTLALSLSTTAMAQDDGWTGEASFAASATSGNTETTDVGLGLALAKTADVWRHKFDASVDYGTASGQDTKNRTFLGYQLDRDINDKLYGFGTANYFKDEFGPFEDGYFVGGGLGYHVFEGEPTFWDLEAGLGYRNQTDRLGNEEGEAAFRAGSDFKYAFNESVSFYNLTELTAASSDTYIWNDIGISAKLTDVLSAKFGVRADYHTDVAPGLENLDTVTRAAIVYTIK